MGPALTRTKITKTPTYIHSNKKNNSNRFTHITHTNIWELPHAEAEQEASGNECYYSEKRTKLDCMPVFTVFKYTFSLCKWWASSENHTESNTHHWDDSRLPMQWQQTAERKARASIYPQDRNSEWGSRPPTGTCRCGNCLFKPLVSSSKWLCHRDRTAGRQICFDMLDCWPQHFRQCDRDGKWHGLITHARRGMISWESVPVIVG